MGDVRDCLVKGERLTKLEVQYDNLVPLIKSGHERIDKLVVAIEENSRSVSNIFLQLAKQQGERDAGARYGKLGLVLATIIGSGLGFVIQLAVDFFSRGRVYG